MMRSSTVIAWIQTGLLTARRDPTNRYLIAFGPQAEAACHARIAAFPWLHAQANTDPPGPDERTPSQIAEQLGVSRDAVYNLDPARLPASPPRPRPAPLRRLHPPGPDRVPATNHRLTPTPRRDQGPSPPATDRSRTMKPPSPWYPPAACALAAACRPRACRAGRG